MRALQSNMAVNTRPDIIVRALPGRAIAARVPAQSLVEDHVKTQVAEMRAYFPEGQFEIDQSQVHYARQGLLGAA